MRLCVPIPCFFTNIDFISALKTIGGLGFDAVETYAWKGLDLNAVKEACDESGVELLSICTTEFRMTDPQYRTLWLDGLKETCEAANKLGVKKLITQVGPDTGAPRKDQHDNIVTTLKEAIPILEAAKVTIMIEPLNTIVNHPGYYLWSAVEGFEIIREVNNPYVKVIYDIYHQQIMEGNIIPNIVDNLDCIAHLHAAGHPGRHELKLGENNYKFIFDEVDKAGYTGACGLEYKPTMNSVESLKEARRLYLS